MHNPRFGPDPASIDDPGRQIENRPTSVDPEFVVENGSSRARTELIQASIPFPKGMVQNLGACTVEGHDTAWRELQQWSDGSVRIAQAQFVDTLPAGARRNYRVIPGVAIVGGTFQPHPWVQSRIGSVRIGARVRDTFGHPYEAELGGGGEVLQETDRMRVRRHRHHHLSESSGGIGRDYLTSTWYVTEFRDSPAVIVDWVLGNDYRGVDNHGGQSDPDLYPLGPVDVNEASIWFSDNVGVWTYEGGRHGVGNRQLDSGRAFYQVMSDTYIADGQTRRYRFVLSLIDPAADPADRQAAQDTIQAMAENPLRPLANWRTWKDTYAAGLYGGPVQGPWNARPLAESEYYTWRDTAEFGTWGSYGDAKPSATTGTPRNGPLSQEMAHAIQGDFPALLHKLELKAWAQAMRPYHLYGLQVGDTQDILLWDGVPLPVPSARDLSPESLGRRDMWANDPYSAYRTRGLNSGGHGWTWGDEEHFSVDLLFDYWTLTGDAWAHEEIRQLGQTLKGLHHYHGFSTSGVRPARAEGWVMQAFVQVYQATQDENIKTYALERIRRVVRTGRNHGSRALGIQWNYPGTGFGGSSHSFYMPWQHGAVLYGFIAAHEFFDDPMPLEIAEDVLTTIRYAWVSDFPDPTIGYVEHGIRYYCPVSFNGEEVPAGFFDFSIGVRWASRALGGTTVMLLGGLHLLADYSETPLARQEALWYARAIGGTQLSDGNRWNKWMYVIPE